ARIRSANSWLIGPVPRWSGSTAMSRRRRCRFPAATTSTTRGPRPRWAGSRDCATKRSTRPSAVFPVSNTGSSWSGSGRGCRAPQPWLQELRHVQGLRGPRPPVQGPGPEAAARRVTEVESTAARPAEGERSLLLLTFALVGAGLVMVLSASQALAYLQHLSPFYYVERQALGAGLGLGAMLLLRRLDYHRLRQLALPAAA